MVFDFQQLLRWFDVLVGLAQFCGRIEAGGFVQQQRHFGEFQQTGMGVQGDVLVRDPEHRLFNRFSVHADPAASNVLFGFTA